MTVHSEGSAGVHDGKPGQADVDLLDYVYLGQLVTALLANELCSMLTLLQRRAPPPVVGNAKVPGWLDWGLGSVEQRPAPARLQSLARAVNPSPHGLVLSPLHRERLEHDPPPHEGRNVTEMQHGRCRKRTVAGEFRAPTHLL